MVKLSAPFMLHRFYQEGNRESNRQLVSYTGSREQDMVWGQLFLPLTSVLIHTKMNA